MYASAEDVKAYLSVSGSSDDGLLARLVEAASAAMNEYMDRNPLTTVYTQTFDGSGNTRQVMSFWPITAVTSVSIDGVAKQAATSFSGSGYKFDDYSIILNNGIFPKGIQNVAITYTAGATVVPPDLKQACIDIASEAYRRRQRVGETSKSLAQGTTSYNIKDMPDHVKVVLSSYKKRSPI